MARPSAAALVDAQNPGRIPPNVFVIDEDNERKEILTVLSGPHPVLLLPLFTRCPSSCPLMARALKTSLESRSKPWRVVLYSFDTADTQISLRNLRERLQLPKDWKMVRAADPTSVRTFFDSLGYRFMSDQGAFLHPREAFVFSPKAEWCATLIGSDWTEALLQKAFHQAEIFGRRSAWTRWSSPDHWVAICGAGIVLAILVIAVTLWVRPRNLT